MMRLCLVGNSHAAALKLGWTEMQGIYPDLDVTVFGAGGSVIRELRTDDGRLVPISENVRTAFEKYSGGQHVIDPQAFDVFGVVGLGFGIRRVVELYATHRTERHRAGDETQLVSQPFFDAAADYLLRKTVAMKTARKIREITDKPILLVSEPMPCEDIADDRHGDPAWADARGADAADLLRLLAGLSRRLPAGMGTVQQPVETTIDRILSPRRLSRIAGLAPALDALQPVIDHYHMNVVYGRIMLAEIIRCAYAVTRSSPDPSEASGPLR